MQIQVSLVPQNGKTNGLEKLTITETKIITKLFKKKKGKQLG